MGPAGRGGAEGARILLGNANGACFNTALHTTRIKNLMCNTIGNL